MNIQLFLNELSQEPPAEDIASGRKRMSEFLRTVSRVREIVHAARVVLRTVDVIDSVLLAPGYPVASWRRDASQPERMKLLQLAVQVPLIERGRDPDKIVDNSLRAECRHEGRAALGIGAAVMSDGLSVSFLSAPYWDTAVLKIELDEVDERSEIHTSQVDARHAAKTVHVDQHESWLRELERLSIKDGQDLWDRRGDLFPALEFCKEVRTQLWKFLGGDLALGPVVLRLVQLQKFFESWDGSPIGPDSLPSKCSPESRVTLQQYDQEHTFTPPHGPARLFSWHVRFTPGAGRIFFDGDPERKKGIVGYIGKTKLPNVSS